MGFLRDNWCAFVLFTAILILMPFDGQVIVSMREFKESGGNLNHFFDILMPIATLLGHGSAIIILGILLLALGKSMKWSRVFFTGKYILIGFLVSGISVQLIKHLFGRARPRLTEDIVFIGPSFVSGFDSFPSGHTAVVFCLAYMFASIDKRLAPLLFTIAIVTGIERVYNMSHFPSDVVAGALTGIAFAQLLRRKKDYVNEYKNIGTSF